MKKVYLSLLAVLLCMPLWIPNTFAASTSSISALYINGQKVTLNAKPLSLSGTVFVPMRDVFNNLGAAVTWNPTTQIIQAKHKSMVITLKVGSRQANVNGKKFTLNEAPKTIQSTTYVPLRFVSESLGAEVQWLASPRAVTITMPNSQNTPSVDSTNLFPLLTRELLAKGRLNHTTLGIGSTFKEVNIALGSSTSHGYDLGAYFYSYSNELIFYFEDTPTAPGDKALSVTLDTLNSGLTTDLLTTRLGKSITQGYDFSDVDGSFMKIYRIGPYSLRAVLNENNLNRVQWMDLFYKPNEENL